VVDAPYDLPQVVADPVRMRQIVLNLGTNALKFTLSGEVALCARVTAGELALSVRDTGIGIAPDHLPLLFEEFTQVGSPLPQPTEPRGSGLGLSIVAKLTRLHGGHISVESEPGSGSVFAVMLPIDGPENVDEVSFT
jgi:signal transduction histidine kinase